MNMIRLTVAEAHSLGARTRARGSVRSQPKPPTEHQEQVKVIAWRDRLVSVFPPIRWLHAIPNGGKRNLLVAKKLKAEGATAGVYDLFLPFPSAGKCGAYCEMKRSDRRGHKAGGLTDDQVAFRDYAKQFYYTFEAYTAEDAIAGFSEYLGHTEWTRF